MSTPELASTCIVAQLVYAEPGADAPYTYVGRPPPGVAEDNCLYVGHSMPIVDAREFLFAPALDAGGFELAEAPTAVRDFADDAEVRSRYYPELEAVVLVATGARRAIVFDHLLRRRDPQQPPRSLGHRPGSRVPGAAGRVHVDYTEASARKRLSLVLGEAEAAAVTGRWSIVNVWRSARGPVLDAPLALCDARSVAAADLVATEVRYTNRNGEIYQLRHNRAHRWSYFHALQPHEAIVFKQYDSNPRVARFTPHAAFEHPHTPPGTPPRESIEARLLVLY